MDRHRGPNHGRVSDEGTTAPVTIAGAGPAGLAAAIAIANAGGRARVIDRRAQAGARFHGDFQGLENWTTERDVLEELAGMGIRCTFEHTPFWECVFFGPDGSEHIIRSEQPLWYLVRRGTVPGTLDAALSAQAVEAGVELELGRSVDHLPEGGLVAHGPYRVDAIAVGYVFETDMADAAFGAISEDLAPAGYSYLLIAGGRATLAACLFDDFHNDRAYLQRTLEFFRTKVGVSMRHESRFGGFGNMSAPPTLRRGKLAFAGEAAGLQDALFGFGMRYALVSGHLAGLALLQHDLAGYERAGAQKLLPSAQAATVNRYLYARLRPWGRSLFLRRLGAAADPRAWLRHRYGRQWWTPMLYPLARADSERRQQRHLHAECREDCDCTFCRCRREPAPVASPAPHAHDC